MRFGGGCDPLDMRASRSSRTIPRSAGWFCGPANQPMISDMAIRQLTQAPPRHPLPPPQQQQPRHTLSRLAMLQPAALSAVEPPEPRRSVGGWLAPALCAIVAITALSWLLISQGQDWGIGVDPDWILLLVTAMATLVAIWVERQVQNQLHLARRGDEAPATIAEFRRPNECRDEVLVRYHYVTADGVRFEGRSMLCGAEFTRVTQPAARVLVLYDPQRPQNNALIGSMWGVSWINPA
jgi:hypothetical protein